MPKKRPEHGLPPALYYDEKEAQKYASNSRLVQVQSEIAERALELLSLPKDESCFILDIGCGSGLSGEVLSENGHFWVGIDVSKAMLGVAVEKDVEGGLLLGDVGCGLPFRAGSFQGAISVSVLQWLCNTEERGQDALKRLRRFFTSLYACLSRGSTAALQFYPENALQVDVITRQAMKAGFSGGIVIDYPEMLFTGGYRQLPTALTTQNHVQTECLVNERTRFPGGKIVRKPPKKSREWILRKKEQARRKGKLVARDSKYTGRKRPEGF
ncbi:Williams Beuren syndrome chromosome region 22 [Trichuris trichiura]|uniref:18S rRNA (guanine-N(7))-methyltransferase n=1 Tax=Trichuris trichiura TaxID=36087 RepID=A0A077ZG97_TRITR|nr:Williams Beuren syndrome chromosome region 22 [Trichuris trichiura]